MVDISTENCVENSTFFYMENYKVWYDDNFLIGLENKSEIILTEYSISNIPSVMNLSTPSEANYNYVITSEITSPIPLDIN